MAIERVVTLVGGVGGVKLAHGLAKVFPAKQLTAIVNTGDDFWHMGLKICPDMDTVMYTLAGVVDPVNGWGVAGDTTAMLDMLRQYNGETWFRLGDRDLATHLTRTAALRGGARLSEVTRRLASALGVKQTILPMTDVDMPTMVDTVEHGEIAFQDYFVRHRWQPQVRGLRYANAASATISDEVADAIIRADAIIIAPSNPWLSIAPILSVPGMRDLLKRSRARRIAVTPIIGGQAVKGPTAKLMAELGYDVTPQTVTDFYGDLLDGFVYDSSDGVQKFAMAGRWARVTAMNTLMRTEADRAVLARAILTWMEQL
jgi:LPPG:FO 2-phospho-L-lactate transferase